MRGSFTGAYRDKPGLLEMAPNGTVFLDEVGEMSTRMQVVLLRFLESGEIQRVGADRSHTRVNVRLITATNRDLAGADRRGRVPRGSLLPAERHPRLRFRRCASASTTSRCSSNYFLHSYGSSTRRPPAEIAPDAMDALMAYRWPGNIRELKNVVERIVLKAAGRDRDPRRSAAGDRAQRRQRAARRIRARRTAGRSRHRRREPRNSPR